MPSSARVPYDRMVCPSANCGLEGSVPGIKRHVQFLHPTEKFEYPPLRTVDGLIDALTRDEELGQRLIEALNIEVPDDASWEEVAEKILALETVKT